MKENMFGKKIKKKDKLPSFAKKKHNNNNNIIAGNGIDTPQNSNNNIDIDISRNWNMDNNNKPTDKTAQSVQQ